MLKKWLLKLSAKYPDYNAKISKEQLSGSG
jgi:hypothetical protein